MTVSQPFCFFKPVINIYCLIALFPISKKDDLEKLATLTRVSLKVRSQLDLDSLERLAAGSFTEVFKAERKGNPVAVKILQNVENVKQIEYYEREVDLLRFAIINK